MKTIYEGLSFLESGQLSSVEWTESLLKRIESKDSKINSFITLNDQALKQAKNSDKKRSAKENLGRLEGVPIAIKDMICTEGIKTTAASKILSEYIPPYSATLVERLEAEGAIVLGKNNMDEFAMGSMNANSYYGKSENPWKLGHSPGGSSGGSAVSVASEFAPASIGTDTGGSVRLPAHHCGLVGLKPTYGRVSRYGVIAYASSLDQAGPICHSVDDAVLLLEVMGGFDSKDATSQDQPLSFSKKTEVQGMRVAVLKESFSSEVHPEIQKVIEETKKELESSGAQVSEVSLENLQSLVATYYLIAMSEASSNLSRYDGMRFGFRAESEDLAQVYKKTRSQGFGQEVKRRILMGTFALSQGYFEEYYVKACRSRNHLRQIYDDVFKEYDVILSPTSSILAPSFSSRESKQIENYQDDLFTVSANLCGYPAMNIPLRTSQEGLPVGVHVMSKHFDEEKLFQIGRRLEKEVQEMGEVQDGLL